ncbi:MAG: hypothetical protein D3904_12590, partial [Candidatus Electrothrix sp. EH2]|nr:hypothetical protein [Candidatus Electrothrix sp. EH2]
MKSFFMTISLLVSLFFTAGTALSYDCYDSTPPPVPSQPCACSQCQKVQYTQQQPCPTRYNQCDETGVRNPFRYDTCDGPTAVRCKYYSDCRKKKRAPRYKEPRYTAPQYVTYQCQTAYTEKKEQVATVQCKLCGTRYLKGVNHYCNKVQCRQRVQKQPRKVGYQCDTVQRSTYRMRHPERAKYRCGEVRCKSCSTTRYLPTDQYNCRNCRNCRSRYQKDCVQKNPCRNEGSSCAVRNCDTSSN